MTDPTGTTAERRPESGLGYHLLLGFLLLMFLMGPLFRQDLGGIRFGQVLFIGIIVGSLIAVGRTKGPAGVALVLGIPALVLGLTKENTTTAGHGWGLAFTCAYLVFLTGLLLVRVKSHRIVTSATVSGSLCVYLLMGLIWGFLYQLLDYFDPAAFRGLTALPSLDDVGIDTLKEAAELRGSELHYFSFVTLTTLGYGDVTPASPAARSLSNTEAIVGQLFLIVAVARLVGIQVGHDLAQGTKGSGSAGT